MSNNLVSTQEKIKITENYLAKLLRIAKNSFQKNNIESVMSALSAYCAIQYQVNQVYTDTQAEDLIMQLSKQQVLVPKDFIPDPKAVLFYDGFGLDLRGWAASFIKALIGANYKVVYVAPYHKKDMVPHILAELEQGNGTTVWINMNQSYVTWMTELNTAFQKYQPGTAFYYTTPNDISAATVFNAYVGKVNRISIDLTDHAFWIGVNAFDYIVESRMPGFSNLVFYRGVPAEKILNSDCCPYVNRQPDLTPLPFDIEKESYVFSGGSLYKTLGDNNLLFYKIVNHILENHNQIKFIYAGEGDDSELNKIIEKYPGRAYHIHERTDFIRLFENCVFFLNTYPMFGGLMMRYAAMVGKIPLTLRHSSDHEGILYDQEKRKIEYDTYDEIIIDVDRLIEDEIFRKEREKLLEGSVLTEQDFQNVVQRMIEEKTTGKPLPKIENLDTTAFRAEYLERLNVQDMLLKTIPSRLNRKLIRQFPYLFIKKFIVKKRSQK